VIRTAASARRIAARSASLTGLKGGRRWAAVSGLGGRASTRFLDVALVAGIEQLGLEIRSDAPYLLRWRRRQSPGRPPSVTRALQSREFLPVAGRSLYSADAGFSRLVARVVAIAGMSRS